MCFMPSNFETVVHSLDVNCAPRSEEISQGRPNRDIQWLSKARAQVLADVSDKGIASG